MEKIAYVEKIVIEDDLTNVELRITGMDNLIVPVTEIRNENFSVDNVITEKIDPSIITKLQSNLENIYTTF